MADDYAARVIALLVEQAGGSVTIPNSAIAEVGERLILLPYAVQVGDEPGQGPDLELQVRNLVDSA